MEPINHTANTAAGIKAAWQGLQDAMKATEEWLQELAYLEAGDDPSLSRFHVVGAEKRLQEAAEKILEASHIIAYENGHAHDEEWLTANYGESLTKAYKQP